MTKNFNYYLLIAIVDTLVYLCTKIHDILLDSTSTTGKAAQSDAWKVRKLFFFL